MPKVSKVTKMTTRPGDAAPPTETIDKHLCTRCGKIFRKQRGHFPYSHSPLYRKNGGYLPVCSRCADELFEHYKHTLGDEWEAMRRICMKFDIYWHPSVYDAVNKASTLSRVSSYISRLNIYKYVSMTYDDTLDEESRVISFVHSDSTGELDPNKPIELSAVQPPTAEVIDFWGPGYTPDVYFELDRRYKKWTKDKDGEIDESSAALYKQVCLCEVTIAKNMAAGKPIEAAQKSMSELLGSLNVKPVQKKQDEAANESFDNMPFGMGIRMCENMRPIPKPDPRFDDVDGIKKYISVWFLGHLCKMLGIRNTYCKLYEDEIASLRIERPELEAEDDEAVFNDIFGDDIKHEDSK